MSDTTSSSVVLVPFHDDSLETIQTLDQKVWVVLRRCCEALGIDTDSQRKRLADKDRSPWACTVVMAVHDSSGRKQDAFLIDLDTVPMWLATIEVGRVKEEARPKLVRYQKECAQVLRDYFFGKPVAPSHPDPIVALMDSMKEVRLMQIETERKIEAARELAWKAHMEAAHAGCIAQAALDTVRSNYGYYSVLAWMRLMGQNTTLPDASQHGKKLSAICRKAGIEPGNVCDPRFGHVNTYPEQILTAYFGPALGRGGDGTNSY